LQCAASACGVEVGVVGVGPGVIRAGVAAAAPRADLEEKRTIASG